MKRKLFALALTATMVLGLAACGGSGSSSSAAPAAGGAESGAAGGAEMTSEWALLNQGKLTEPRYVDTVAMDVNQKYIYYKVRAID